MQGSITRLNKKIGCGFIRGDDGFEAYFDVSSLQGIDIQALSIGKDVEYQEHFGHERLQATKITAIPNPRSKSATGS